MSTHIHVETTTAAKLETVLEGERLADVKLHWVGARDWVVLIEHENHRPGLVETDVAVGRDKAQDLKASYAERVPGWFVYLWQKLADRQILDIEFLKEHLDAPRWVIDYLEAPVLSDGFSEIDTRVETLRRIYNITQGGPADGTSRSDWALEALGEIRGLAHSQI